MKAKTKILITFLVLAAIGLGSIQAQTFEEYKKQRQQQLEKYKDEREKQMQQLADEFSKYVEQQDKEYADYLKKRWQEFQVFKGVKPPDEPKPEEAPVFEEPERPLPLNPIPVVAPPVPVPPLITPKPVIPRVTKPEPVEFPVFDKEFDFYGFPVSFDYDENMAKVRLMGNPNEEAISDIFNQLSNTNYNDLLEQFYEYADLMNLNDWGYYKLLQNAAATIAGPDENTQRLFTWFLLIRSGYKARVAYFDNMVYTLLPIRNQVYDVKYFNLDDQRFYLIDGDLTKIYTYDKDFQEAQKTFDLNLYDALALGDQSVARMLSYSYQGDEKEVPVAYNRNVIDFYKDYPLADIKVYFDAMVSPDAKTSISRSFLPLLQGMTELQKANLLLHFVQTAFDYETDQEQFGYEKFFFAEEVFYYPYCDCEDRSVLFSYMVQNLLGLEVIGLNYPGHMATAVCFNDEVAGDYLDYNGKKYVVCDPTYIGAPVGLTMPAYKNDEANIVVLENRFFEGRQHDNLWDDVMAAGGRRGDNGDDILLNDDGSGILTGYFTGAFNYGNIAVPGDDQPAMFALMLDAQKQPVWFSNSSGGGPALAYNLVRDENENVYVTGTFKGSLEIDGRNITGNTEGPDIFLAKFSRNGELQWLSNAGIDTANRAGNTFLNFVATFAPDGRHLENKLYFESGDFSNYGISFGPDEVVVAGAFNKTTGMNVKKASYESAGEFNAVEALKAENDRLITDNYEKTIAGLFAMVNLVQSSGVSIPGSAAREVLDKYNPKFKDDYPEIYETILKVQFIKNQDGVVTVKTDDGKEMAIDMMRVKNDARLKISMLENGDARIDVLSGIRVGKAFWWYDLNHIIMYKSTGDLLFDYDVDHELARKNLKIDILY